MGSNTSDLIFSLKYWLHNYSNEMFFSFKQGMKLYLLHFLIKLVLSF